MATEDVIIRADYRGAFGSDELGSLADALRLAIADPAVSIGIVYLHYYGDPRTDVLHLMVRFHFARREPPECVSNEATETILRWARTEWRRHEQTREDPRPIVVTVIYDDRRDDHAWRSEVLKRVVLDRPDGEPRPFEGHFGGPGARPEPPTWLYGPKHKNQSTG